MSGKRRGPAVAASDEPPTFIHNTTATASDTKLKRRGKGTVGQEELVSGFANAMDVVRKAHRVGEAAECNMFKSPGKVLVYSMIRILSQILSGVKWFVSHPVFFLLVAPMIGAYVYMLFYLEGAHLEYFHYFNLLVQDGVFWFVLGVASSIGFGSGMHSGLLFLFPHIYKVCMSADVCGNLSFGTNVFLNGGPAEGLNILPIGNPDDLPTYCGCDPTEGAFVEYWPRVLAVMTACMLWGAGTAFGEIPPYLLALKASDGGASLIEEEMGDESFAVVEKMKTWTIDKVKRWGFLAVFLLASWPNAFFDLCGLCCGAIRMPFLTFFSACLLGKGVVKVGLQSMFFVLVFTKSSFEIVMKLVSEVAEKLLPNGADVANWLNELAEAQLDKFRHGHQTRAEGHKVNFMGLIVFLFVAHFMGKALEQFAIDKVRGMNKAHEEHIKSLYETTKDLSVVKPREPSRKWYSLVIVLPTACVASYYYLGASFSLMYVTPLATLLLLFAMVGPSKALTPLDCARELPVFVFILTGLGLCLVPLMV